MTLSAPSGAQDFHRASHLYRLPELFGSGAIVREYIGLAQDAPLPLAIPHGIDCHINHFDLDESSFEPLYLALRPDIAARVGRVRHTLTFPHPWLLIKPTENPPAAQGTLFIGPPPSEKIFAQMVEAIACGDYPKPWGVLLKERGIETRDFDWWRQRGFAIHTAGSIHNPRFYHDLRAIIERYETVASPNMSSAVVFAVSLGKRAVALPDIVMEVVDHERVIEGQDLADAAGNIHRVWSNLMSPDTACARRQALDLLGEPYLDTAEALRARYDAALARIDRVVHLAPLAPGLIHALIQRLILWGVPLHRVFPNPIARIRGRLARAVGRDQLAVIRGSDFTHYGIAPGRSPIRIEPIARRRLGAAAEIGYALRSAPVVPTDLQPVGDPPR